ncbi:hypothetical protein G8V03_14160 [Clostridium botulinum D/C]|uniref:hypothetical protein n=1 Tax=Clostridium botulinum TaxID=1491 RepID=UPI001E4E21B9|nr:hypothetical protein [Clostridium botulinum]MCD3352112.1 hypothetical protein [Clostridium botulinum D/C]MCD3361051.1 hypothetical protein [Clostridium botulinum D/C]MCD3363170.1 hypothetical protein [Clostridium botulinum D/C]MCD3366793.1 hypothetical protein [Clostridium botulinum D/C]
MGKLIKYELKGNYKIFSALCIIASILNIVSLTRLEKWGSGPVTGCMSMVTMSLFIISLVIIINSFKNELYEDRGYLTFTLPISGNKILASKLICALVWFSLTSIVSLIFFKILIGTKGADIVRVIISLNLKSLIIFAIAGIIINTITLLLMIYFSIALTKVARRGKKVSGILAFVVFIALSFLIYYISFKLSNIFPQQMHIALNLNNYLGGNGSINNMAIKVTDANLTINIASAIYQIFVYIGLFIGTGYLMEKKINI